MLRREIWRLKKQGSQEVGTMAAEISDDSMGKGTLNPSKIGD